MKLPYISFPSRYRIPCPSFISKDSYHSLYISSNTELFPQILTDPPQQLLSNVFNNSTYDSIKSVNGYHVYYDKNLQWTIQHPNLIATALLRNDILTTTGLIPTDSIYGDVVVFGSYDYSNYGLEFGDYSVPYEILEQVQRLYEIYSTESNSH